MFYTNIELCNVQGQVLSKYNAAATKIDISSLKKGMYNLRFTSSSGSEYRKIERN